MPPRRFEPPIPTTNALSHSQEVFHEECGSSCCCGGVVAAATGHGKESDSGLSVMLEAVLDEKGLS